MKTELIASRGPMAGHQKMVIDVNRDPGVASTHLDWTNEGKGNINWSGTQDKGRRSRGELKQ